MAHVRKKTARKRFASEPTPARRSDPAKIQTTIGGSATIDPALEDDARRRLARKLGKHAAAVESIAVRITGSPDAYDPAAVGCRIVARLQGIPDMVVEEHGAAAELVLRRAADALGRRVARALRHVGRASPASLALRDDEGSLIGRRVGQARQNLERALARPGKGRRDTFVDTADPGVNASDRKAGYGSTAARNTRRNVAGMTAALEDSRGAPSRKSTRRSTNRAKAATAKQRTVQLAAHAPKVEATRARARKASPRGS